MIRKDPKLQEIVNKLTDSYAPGGKAEYRVHYRKLGEYINDEDAQYVADNYDIRTDVHPMCIACQTMQVNKYYGKGTADDAPEDVNKFKVDCSYVPASAPPEAGQLLERLIEGGVSRDEAKRTVLAHYDPVAWAEHHFGFRDELDGQGVTEDGEPIAEWRLRPWQKEGMRCSSKRLVLRWGRRSGKTFSFCLKIIHQVFNLKIADGVTVDKDGNTVQKYKGPKIVIVTPFEAQLAETIFPQIESLLKNSKDLVKEVVGGSKATGKLYKKSPAYNMHFKNGASIIGMIAGTGEKADGSGGGAARGLTGDIIYSDEMDMIAESVLQASISPITIDRPHARIWVSSTPIGKPGLFKQYCEDNPRWKEIYFPSTMLSNWKNIEAEKIEETGATQFKAEYLALFIDDNYGVFRRSWIINAMRDYSYDDTTDPAWWRQVAQVPRSKTLRVLGIDWNQTHGSEYVVVAYDPVRKNRWVIDAVNVPYEKFDSQAYKDKLIELALKHRVHWIYADKGYGHHLINDIKFISNRMRMRRNLTPDQKFIAGLEEKIVAVEFGGNIELRDPIDGTIIKKRTKQYLVQNARNDFETGRLFFPGNHSSAVVQGKRAGDKTMYQQLSHYVVLRVGDSGMPKYGSDSKKVGDHRLDALMCALMGIHQQKSIYAEEHNAVVRKPGLFKKDELLHRYGHDDIPKNAQPSNVIQNMMQANGYDGAITTTSQRGKKKGRSGMEHIQRALGLDGGKALGVMAERGQPGAQRNHGKRISGKAMKHNYDDSIGGNDTRQPMHIGGFARRSGPRRSGGGRSGIFGSGTTRRR